MQVRPSQSFAPTLHVASLLIDNKSKSSLNDLCIFFSLWSLYPFTHCLSGLCNYYSPSSLFCSSHTDLLTVPQAHSCLRDFAHAGSSANILPTQPCTFLLYLFQIISSVRPTFLRTTQFEIVNTVPVFLNSFFASFIYDIYYPPLKANSIRKGIFVCCIHCCIPSTENSA